MCKVTTHKLCSQAETVRLALERESAQLAVATSQLHSAQQEMQDTKQHINHRLAMARWHFAGAAVCLPAAKNLIPIMPPRRAGQAMPDLVRQARSLERMTAARTAAQQHLKAFRAERALKKGVANLRKDGTAGDAFSAAVRVDLQSRLISAVLPHCSEYMPTPMCCLNSLHDVCTYGILVTTALPTAFVVTSQPEVASLLLNNALCKQHWC